MAFKYIDKFDKYNIIKFVKNNLEDREMDRAHWTPEDLARGYAREEGGYRCAACGRLFEEG